jgi:hypothetical protein
MVCRAPESVYDNGGLRHCFGLSLTEQWRGNSQQPTYYDFSE